MEEVIILITSMAAGMATYIVSNILKRGVVIGSALITLISGFMLPHLFPSMGNVMATAAACASYAGMISVENALNLFDMAIVSLITGIMFIAASNAYVGIGGRLGTIAAISCFAWLGFKKVFVNIDDLSNR